MNRQEMVVLREHQEAVLNWPGNYERTWLGKRHDEDRRHETDWGAVFTEAMSSLQGDTVLWQVPREYRCAIKAWTRLGVEGGYYLGASGCAPLRTRGDFAHSSLLHRIVAGEHVFHHAPPRAMAYPWMSLIADRAERVSISKSSDPFSQGAADRQRGKTYVRPGQSMFEVTEQSEDGWIYATSLDTLWKIRARRGELSEVEYEEARKPNRIPESFKESRLDWPYCVWELQVLNTPAECAGYSSVDEILTTLRPGPTELPGEPYQRDGPDAK